MLGMIKLYMFVESLPPSIEGTDLRVLLQEYLVRFPTLPIVAQRCKLLEVPSVESFPNSLTFIVFQETSHSKQARNCGRPQSRLGFYFQ